MSQHDAGRREPAINLPAFLTVSIVVLILINLARGWISDGRISRSCSAAGSFRCSGRWGSDGRR